MIYESGMGRHWSAAERGSYQSMFECHTSAAPLGRATIDSATLGIRPGRLRSERGLAFPTPALETLLRAIDRVVRMDWLVAQSLRIMGRRSSAQRW